MLLLLLQVYIGGSLVSIPSNLEAYCRLTNLLLNTPKSVRKNQLQLAMYRKDNGWIESFCGAHLPEELQTPPADDATTEEKLEFQKKMKDHLDTWYRNISPEAIDQANSISASQVSAMLITTFE